MATPKPKQFTASRPFSSRGRWYQTGDPVTDRRTIARLVPHGDKYLSWTVAKPAKAETTPAVDTATTQPASEED
jgi:hypothetical protein